MKACVLGLRGIPDVAGGIETHCQQLLPRLKRIRSNDEFYVLARRGYVPDEPYEYEGLTLVPLWHAKGKHFEAISNALAGVFHARFTERADVIHIHAIGPALVAPIAKLLGMKVIVTHHGTDYSRAKWNGFAKQILRMGERCAILFADRVIAVSPSLAENLKQAFPKHSAKIVYVPNGASHLKAPDSDADTSVVERFGLNDANFTITVGRIVPEKGFHDLIEAFIASGSNGKLVIAGGANDDDPYFRKLRDSANDQVIFTGFLSHAELAVLLHRASLFVLPSYHEGLPIAALEAATCGAPILVSDIQPNIDLQLPDQNYFKVGDIDDLTDKLRRDSDTYRVDIKETAERFDWDVIAGQTSDVYSSVAA